VRIDRLGRRPEQCRLWPIAGFVLGKFLKASAGTDGINVPLGKDSAKPGLQGTSSVKVAEERPLRSFAVGQTVQLRKKRIRQIAGFCRARRAPKDCCCRCPQVGSVGIEKMLPRGLLAISTGGSQSQVFQMECGKIIVELSRSHRSGCQSLLCATLQRGGKARLGKPPAACLRLSIKPLEGGGLPIERTREIHHGALKAGFWRVFHHQLSNTGGRPPG